MPVDAARAEAIFTAALGREPEQRAAFVEGACRDDPELRARVESLLAAHEGLGSFLEPSTRLQPILGAISEGPGSRIGRYKLLQLIGEGGFGSVFMAEQEEPVRRRVALKIVKLGMDTRQVIARFEAERQALALMDHPNIAKVLDAGATDTGRPYFVMELVKGVPITEYCDTNNLSTADRVELLIAVCNAVQHAHQKGVIHRDIKPSNVLVTLHDGKPVPKVIDFGIAKATSQRLTEKTVFTEYRQFIGTPAYTSPEQAEMSGLDVDTRSDIYSLGVLLYELLTGATPFDPTKLREAAYAEIQRIIREVEPQRPSIRLSTMGNELSTKARQRSVDPMQLRKQVSGDLDWIVMKCLEKDRTRRYETASGLGADLRRHLRDEPVAAGPPSAIYQLRKLARRNRGKFVAVGAVAAALILGLSATSIGFIRANRARRSLAEALVATQAARDEKESQKQEALYQQHAAELALSRGMLSEANALDLAGRWNDADARYTQALREFQRLKQPTLPVEFSMFGHFASSPPPLMTYAMEGRIGTAIFFKEGRRALVRDTGRKILLVDLTTGATLRTIELPTAGYFGGLAISSDETNVICGGANYLWKIDLQSGKAIWSQRVELPVSSIAENHECSLIVVGRADAVFELRDEQNGQKIREFRGHARGPSTDNAARFTPDGHMVLSAATDGTARLWKVDTGKEVRSFAQEAPIGGLAMTGDGRLAITTSAFRDTEVRVWDLQSGSLVRTLHTAAGTIKAIVSPDDHTLICGGVGNAITFFDLASGRTIGVLHANGAIIPDLALSPDGQTLLSCSLDSYFQLWSAQRNAEVPTIEAAEVADVAISRDGRLGATFGGDQLITLWNLATSQRLEIYDGGAAEDGEMAFSPDGQMLARISSDGQVRVWNLAAPAPRAVWMVHAPKKNRPASYCLDFAPDGKTVVTGGSDGLVKLWDVATGKLLQNFSGHGGPVTKVVFTQSGGRIASCALDKSVRLWDQRSGATLRVIENAPEQPVALAVSADERSLAVFGSYKLAVYDLQTGNLRRLMNSAPQYALALSDDGAYLLEAGWDRELRMFDLGTGNQVRGIEGHQGLINAMATTPQMDAAFTASGFDGTARFWDWRRSAQYISQLPLVGQARATLAHEPGNAAAWAQLGQWYAFRGMDAWAIELLEKAKKLGANVSPLLLADCAARLGDVAKSADALRDALAAAPSPQEKPYLQLRLQAIGDAAQIARQLASRQSAAEAKDQAIAAARKGEFEQARIEFARAIELNPSDLWPWYYQGCLLAYLSDKPAYREHCKAMLAQFGASRDTRVADRAAKTCLLLAGAGGDPQQLAAWVLNSPPIPGLEGWLVISKAMAEYRRGNFKAALQWLDHRPIHLDVAGEATLDFYLAMTLQKLGNVKEAKQAIQRADEIFQKLPSLDNSKAINLEDWLICQVAHREAEAVMQAHAP